MRVDVIDVARFKVRALECPLHRAPDAFTFRGTTAHEGPNYRAAREILGANGVTDDYQCGRHMLNLESVYTYEGTNEIHTLIVGETLTGLRAYE